MYSAEYSTRLAIHIRGTELYTNTPTTVSIGRNGVRLPPGYSMNAAQRR